MNFDQQQSSRGTELPLDLNQSAVRPNIQSSSSMGNLEPLNFQFQNMNMQGNNPGVIPPINQMQPNANGNQNLNMMGNNQIPLSRSNLLMESMNIKRSSSSSFSVGTQESFLHTPPVQNHIPLGGSPANVRPANLRTSSGLFNAWPQQSNVLNHSTSSTPGRQSALLNTAISMQDVSSIAAMNNGFNIPGSNINIGLHRATSMLDSTQLSTPTSLNSNLFAPPGPPGIGTFMPVAVKSQWKYRDQQNQVQGPFDTSNMSFWYSSNYFQPSLQICRLGTSFEPFGINDRFITLAELANIVKNSADPFTAFDQAATLVNAPIQNKPTTPSSKILNLNPLGNTNSVPVNKNISNVSNTTGEHHKKTFAELINESKSNLVPVANIENADYTLDEIFKLKCDDGSFYHEVIVPVPVNRKHIKKIDPSTKIEDNLLPDYWNIEETTDYHAKMEVFKKEEEEKAVLQLVQDEKDRQHLDIQERQANLQNEEIRRKQKAELMAKKLLEEQERAELEYKKREEMKNLKKQQKFKEQQDKLLAQQTKQERKQNPKFTGELETTDISMNEQHAAKPVLAPWANKTNSSNKIPTIDLRKESSLQKKLDEEKELRERQRAMTLNEQIYKEEKEKENMKSVLTWASKPAAKQTSVSFDIKSQLTKKEPKDIKTKLTANAKSSEFVDASFIEEQKKLWEQVQRSNKSKTPSGTPSSGGTNSWTTVSAKTTTTKPVLAHKSVSKLIGSSTSIPTLKNKVTNVPAVTAYPGNASISARQEFLRWCKAQMKLSPGVAINSVLEVLLSLPAGPEAKEIIADTIYSNSSVMDGRRFATEFIKRRVDCERQVKDPLSWSEALALPEGNEDDWEFQVVSKKKGRKH